MGLFKVVCIALLAVVARTQVLPDCSITPPSIVDSTEDAAALATSLQCSNGEFAVEWIGEVLVEETFYVTGGTSLNVTGTGPGAIADGGGSSQLFYVEGGSSLHLLDMTLAHANTTGAGAAIYANQSYVSFSGNISFVSNSAGNHGGAIYAYDSTVSWDGDGTQFRNNIAYWVGGAIFATNNSVVSWDGEFTQFSNNSATFGGAIAAPYSTVSWDGDGTQFRNNIAYWDGGAIYAYYSSTVSWDGDGTQFRNNYASVGGAICASYSSNVSWDGDGTQFLNNIAYWDGGAIYAYYSSTVSWDGDGTQLRDNIAYWEGGAIYAYNSSTVSWDGDGTTFSDNYADKYGGAISASESTVSWHGDGTQFSDNSAPDSAGGAISASESTVSWVGDGTHFSNNSVAGNDGGAIRATSNSTVSWDGDGTEFRNNSAAGGGAISAYDSTVSWVGDETLFISNSASRSGGAIYAYMYSTVSWDGDGTTFSDNSADKDGGAISAAEATVSWDGHTSFSDNVARENGGALFFGNFDFDIYDRSLPFIGMAFVNNSAGLTGGAIHILNCVDLNFTNVTFESNSASGAGGAVAAYVAGDEERSVPATFSRCFFLNNKAPVGGAVETLVGRQEFISCDFEGNSADVGGAMRLGGTGVIRDCSFLSNSVSTRGLAIAAVVESVNISRSSFDGNDMICASGSYREYAEETRYEAVCFDCPDWDGCSGCTIEKGDLAPVCAAPLENTKATEPGSTLETLTIEGGFWRATITSKKILACHNPDACRGGVTGTGSFCASGYDGPYCAVCEAGYSPSLGHTCTRCSSSRRHGLVAAAVIAAIVAVFAVATIFKYLLSSEVEEGNFGCFRRGVLRALPVQALKIIVVVWQILTQFADVANVTYPGVYQDFLSAIDVVNFDFGSVLAAGCLWPGIDFHGRLLVSTLGPLVVVGFLAMTYRIAVRRNGASSESAVEKIRHKHQTALLLLTFLVYSSVSSMVFQTFACETLDDGIEYLRADYRIRCTDAEHKIFEVYAGFMAFVYPLGIPFLYAVLLFQRRDVLADADADKTVAQPIAGLWEAYRPERFFYEIIECGRRILLTGVVVFIFPNTAAQITITMLIAFFFFAVFEVLSPYTSESDTWLSRGGHVIVFLSMFDLLLLKVDVSGERDQSQAAFAGVLVAGHVLMVLAIVVEVAGVCYASRKKNGVEGSEEASERPRVGSDDVPAFESAPASWRSFFRQRSVSEKTGPTRSISGNLVTTGGP